MPQKEFQEELDSQFNDLLLNSQQEDNRVIGQVLGFLGKNKG
jgi:hypothetical protein